MIQVRSFYIKLKDLKLSTALVLSDAEIGERASRHRVATLQGAMPKLKKVYPSHVGSSMPKE
jgi:hypothetical protein